MCGSAVRPTTIFLDIDGVLRRHTSPKYQLESDLVANFERWVHAQGRSVEIVISSTWKDAFTLDEIRSHFPESTRKVIVGATRVLAGRIHDDQRYREILAYVSVNSVKEPWRIIDDQPSLFPRNLASLIVVIGEEGFQFDGDLV